MVENIRPQLNNIKAVQLENWPFDDQVNSFHDIIDQYNGANGRETNFMGNRTPVYNTAKLFASSALHLLLATNSASESSEKINKDVSKQIKKLKSKNAEIRKKAAEALGDMGPAASAAVPALIEAFKDKDYFVNQAVVKALGKIGEPALPALMTAVSDNEEKVRTHAIETIGVMGKSGLDVKQAIPLLINAMNDKSYDTQWAAVEALVNLNEDALPQLIQAMATGEGKIPENAILTMVLIGPEAQVAVPGLIGIIKNDAKKDLHNQAVSALGKIGGLAIPALVELVKKGDPRIIKLVIPAFALFWSNGLGLEARPYILGPLEKELKSDDANKRIEAARNLGDLGFYSEQIVANLEKMLESEITNEKWSAAMALVQIDYKSHSVEMPLLLKCLEVDPPYHEFAIIAVHAIASHGKDAKDAIPYLLEMVKWYCYEDVVKAAANALGEIGIASEEVINTLKEVIKDQSPLPNKEKKKKVHHDPHYNNPAMAWVAAKALEKLTGEITYKEQTPDW
jgi:HEAT repeat protein